MISCWCGRGGAARTAGAPNEMNPSATLRAKRIANRRTSAVYHARAGPAPAAFGRAARPDGEPGRHPASDRRLVVEVVAVLAVLVIRPRLVLVRLARRIL